MPGTLAHQIQHAHCTSTPSTRPTNWPSSHTGYHSPQRMLQAMLLLSHPANGSPLFCHRACIWPTDYNQRAPHHLEPERFNDTTVSTAESKHSCWFQFQLAAKPGNLALGFMGRFPQVSRMRATALSFTPDSQPLTALASTDSIRAVAQAFVSFCLMKNQDSKRGVLGLRFGPKYQTCYTNAKWWKRAT